ncbi:MAG: lamin tail domain-containing protein, partial [Leptospirales bacterium]
MSARFAAALCLVLGLLPSHCILNDTEDPFDLLGLILNGTAPVLLTQYSLAGPGNDGGALEGRLVQTINLSTLTLYCVFEDVNLPGVIRSLHIAKLRGVDVRVGLDADNATHIGHRLLSQFLDTAGDPKSLLTGNQGGGGVYMNLCVADRSRVFASSAPPTFEGFYNQNAFSVYLQSDPGQGIAQKFNVVMDLITNDSFGSAKQRLNRRNHWLVGGLDVGIYFAPEEDPVDFIGLRAGQSFASNRIYTSEFSANATDTAADVRKAGDLAFETRASSAPIKQVLGSWKANVTADDDSTVNTNEGNSMKYLRDNGVAAFVVAGEWPVNGANLAVFDGGTPNSQTYLCSAPFSKRSNTSHDGFMFAFEDPRLAGEASAFLDALAARSVLDTATATNIAAGGGREVVISELNWMGAYRADLSGTNFEYVELYNTTADVINLGGWSIQCGNGGGFATTVGTIPTGTILGPGQYFIVTDDASSNTTIKTPHLKMNLGGSGVIDNTSTDQCRLIDGDATVIDVIGVSGTTFASRSDIFGLNDESNNLRRSMERLVLTSAGDNLTNWATNSNASFATNFNIGSDFLDRTFGTPGYRNSAGSAGPPPTPPADQTPLLINEWADAGTNVDYIEIKNFGAAAVPVDSNLRVNFGGGTSASVTAYLNNGEGDPANQIAIGGGVSIAPGEIILVVDSDVAIADITTIRGYNGFTGKIFLSDETTLIGGSDRLDDAQAAL